MNKTALTILLLFFTTILHGQEARVGSSYVQDFFNATLPEELKDKQWNRWTSKNFVVCSIDDNQARYLNANLEKIKEWIFTRWGIDDFEFEAECRLLCVDDKNLYKKMFGIETSKVELKTENGKKFFAVFLLLDDKPAKTIPIPITQVCMTQFEKRYDMKLGWWAYRGMGQLNSSIIDIRKQLAELNAIIKADKPMYFSDALFNTTEEQYAKLSVEQQQLFDRNAMALTLLLRKEFGQGKFLQFLKETGKGKKPEAAMQSIYGFANFNQFDATFKRYMTDLTADVIGVNPKRVTPDAYLQIKRSN